MRKIRFKDLFDFQSKSKLKAGIGKKEGKYPFYTSSPVQSKYSENSQFQGEHLIFGTGGSASVHYNNKLFSVSTDCLTAKPIEKSEPFNSKYVFYYLRASIHILELGFRGAGLKHISKSYIANLSIPLPSFGEQNQIVEILDKASNLFLKHEALINFINDLKFSSYKSLFGDARLNTNGWSVKPLDQVAEVSSGVTKGRKLKGRKTVNAPYMRVANVQDGYIDISEIKEVKVLPSDIEKYLLQEEDILLTEGGDPDKLGRGGVWRHNIKNCIHQNHIFKVRSDQNQILPDYLASLISSGYGKVYFLKSAKQTTGIASINITQLKRFPVLVPPKKTQKKYAQIIDRINSIKLKLNDVLEEDFLLLEALKQNAFTGKLKANLDAFSIDNQVVNYIEKEYEKKEKLSEDERVFYDFKEAIRGYFNDRAFAFSEIEQAITEYGLDINYEYDLIQNKRGLKDLIFKCLSSNSESQIPFLKQAFLVDENRDAEKNNDDSKIMLEINNY